VVQPTYVLDIAGHYPLSVPTDGCDKATLAEALVQGIQWPKDMILIPPMTRHPNPEAATGSMGTIRWRYCSLVPAREGSTAAVEDHKTTQQECRQ
jgi:hypothetical protein